MKETDYDLMFCCLGNGTTVCNRARTIGGDYERIAHISDAGNIRWSVKPSSIPGSCLIRIEHIANVAYEKFIHQFSALSDFEQYKFLLDRALHAEFMGVIQMADAALEEKINYLRRLVIPRL